MTSRWRDWMDFGAVLLGLVVLWQVMSWYAGNSTLASPSTTLAMLSQQFQRGSFWDHVQATMEALSLSLVIGLAGGLSLGILFGMARRAGVIAEPILASLYSLPKITLYPLVLLTFGLGMSAKVVYGVMRGIIPVIMIVMVSIRELKPVYQRTAKVMRLSRWDIVRTIVIPATLPDLLSALRLGFSLSLLGVLIVQTVISIIALHENVLNGIYFSTRSIATVADEPTSNSAQAWFKALSAVDTVAAVVLAGVIGTAFVQAHTAWWTVSMAATGISGVQLGYLIGLGLRFVLEAAGSEVPQSFETTASSTRHPARQH